MFAIACFILTSKTSINRISTIVTTVTESETADIIIVSLDSVVAIEKTFVSSGIESV